MKNEKEIGKIVRSLRGNLSLREFGEKCGISHTTIDNLEKGIDVRTGKPTQVKVNTLEKIASACGVSVSLFLDDEPTQPSDKDETLKVALFGGDGEVTDEMWDEVKKYAEYLKSRNKT